MDNNAAEEIVSYLNLQKSYQDEVNERLRKENLETTKLLNDFIASNIGFFDRVTAEIDVNDSSINRLFILQIATALTAVAALITAIFF